MARDHTRVNLDIWGDDEFLDLPVDAQALYWRMWTSPGRTYCGSHEWRPGKLIQSAGDWTSRRLEAAAAVLSERLFLIIDVGTEECLLRSWIKHDGLWKQPNMAVSMANARSALGSKVLRGVIVHEVKKLAAAEPNQGGWKRDEVKKMLRQNPIDPATITPFNPGPDGGINPPSDPPADPPVNPYGRSGINPPADPPSTTATSTPTATSTKEGGYLGRERHLVERPHCPRHPHENSKGESCPDCQRRREWDEAQSARTKADQLTERRARRSAIDNCELCDPNGKRENRIGHLTDCNHPDTREEVS